MKTFIFTFVTLLFFSTSSFAQMFEFDDIGKNYEISEKSALQEIQDAAKKVDWAKVMDKDKMLEKVNSFKPENAQSLPTATEDKTFDVDMTYTLDMDIPDGKGGILYPKGYTFNPLEYSFLPNIIVVINADDEDQVKWLKESKYFDDFRTMILLSDGKYFDVMKDFKKPVFFLPREVVSRFKLKAVPSVVMQKGTVMEVREFDVKQKPEDNS